MLTGLPNMIEVKCDLIKKCKNYLSGDLRYDFEGHFKHTCTGYFCRGVHFLKCNGKAASNARIEGKG